MAVNWKRLSAKLASRLESHAFCFDHDESKPDADCPFCIDRSVYMEYQRALTS